MSDPGGAGDPDDREGGPLEGDPSDADPIDVDTGVDPAVPSDPAVDPDLSGEVAVVTGGTRGIGLAVARRLVAAGATTVATYRGDEAAARRAERELAAVARETAVDPDDPDVTEDPDAPQSTGDPETTAASGDPGSTDDPQAPDGPGETGDRTGTDDRPETAVRQFDVRDSEAVRSAFESIREEHGVPTLLVNNAGVMRNGPLVRMSDEDWETVVETNLTGAFNCLRTAARWMLRADGGVVVNVASIAGQRGFPGQANYAASKAGLIGLTRSAARELGDRDVRVVAVAPGYVETEMYEEFAHEGVREDTEAIPQGRLADPEEVADAVLYLASDAAAYVTGSVLRIDGGRIS